MQENYDYTIVSGVPSGEYMPNWSSIFIPSVPPEMTRQYLIDTVEKKLNLGKVSRIDFAATKYGSNKMAFIHMALFHDTLFTFKVRTHMEEYGFWQLPKKYQWTHTGIKLRFVINRNPVPKIDFTIETLADMVARQSYIIEKQSADIQKLEQNVNFMMVSKYLSSNDKQRSHVADDRMNDNHKEECRSQHEQTQVDLNDLHNRVERIEHRARVQHYKMREEEYMKDMGYASGEEGEKDYNLHAGEYDEWQWGGDIVNYED